MPVDIYCIDFDGVVLDVVSDLTDEYCTVAGAIVGRWFVQRSSIEQSIELGHGVNCCCVSGSDVAAIMLQLCLLLMVVVTGYCVGQYK